MSMLKDANYAVDWLPIEAVHPSPENDDLYGAVQHDEQMEALIKSIGRRGIEEPLIVTEDKFILSGHRRYFALKCLDFEVVPVRIKRGIRHEANDEFHRLLAEYNPQRIKTAGSLLKEALLRLDGSDARTLIRDHKQASVEVDAEFLKVDGVKSVSPVSDKKQGFLTAVQGVIDDLREYWPLSIRQIHYRLLNSPPLTSEPKKSKFKSEHYRYRNNRRSYEALVELLKSARYHGHVSMTCIDDPTRPMFAWRGWTGVSQFIQAQMEGFLTGYHRDRQLDQPRHIEVLGEKNTLLQILKPVCREYYVPLTLGRGYASIPVWRNIAKRFRASGKDRMTLITASDYDPEGLDLADDAIRSLKQLFGVPVDYQRVAVNRDQIDSLSLAADFNPAKETSSRLRGFVERTGGNETWELEALPPDYLRDQVRAAIEANMDMELYEQSLERELDDAEELAGFRRQLISSMGLE